MESFNAKLRNELLAREVFDALIEAKVLIERLPQFAGVPASGPGGALTDATLDDLQ